QGTPAAMCEGSIRLTRVNLPRAFGVTSSQVAPPSRDTWTRPSSDPAHSTPAFTGDSAKAKIVPYHSVPVMSRVIGPPTGPSVAGSWGVRSGLIACQWVPPSVVRNTFWAVAYSVLRSCGENTIGKVHWNRYGTSAAACPS